MSYSPENGPSLPPYEERPVYKIRVDNKEYHLEWHNTELHLFYFGQGDFDYLVHEFQDGEESKIIFMFLRSLEDREELVECLQNDQYPVIKRPLQTEIDVDLYTRSNSGDSSLEDVPSDSFDDSTSEAA